MRLDFIKRHNITFSTDSLSLCADEKMVKVVELPMNHLLEISQEEVKIYRCNEKEI